MKATIDKDATIENNENEMRSTLFLPPIHDNVRGSVQMNFEEIPMDKIH